MIIERGQNGIDSEVGKNKMEIDAGNWEQNGLDKDRSEPIMCRIDRERGGAKT